MSASIDGPVLSAAKWSLLAEVIAKVVTPVTQLVLARLLAPEVFGAIAIVVMVVSFGEMISDAGFQKYLVQFEFKDKPGLYRYANVAFWTSTVIATLLLVLVILFRDAIARGVGAPGLGLAIAVASLSLPLSVLSGTQQALFRRALEYKKVLPVRVCVVLVPLATSVPLAVSGFGYWSLVIGLLASHVVNAVAMTLISPWRPRLEFSFVIFRRMFAFSGWTLLEAISIWATVWSSTFIVGNVMSANELGLYRQPMLVINSVFSVVTSATTPILFAALSRLQGSELEFRRFYLRFQFIAASALLPVGVGIFFYREFFTFVLFGPQWTDAALMVGAWALSSSLVIVLSHYSSELFRAVGKPRVSLLSQLLYMAIMVPAIYFAAVEGFTCLVIVASAVRVFAVLISQILARIVIGIGFLDVLRTIAQPLIAAIIMSFVSSVLSRMPYSGWVDSVGRILLSAAAYLVVCIALPGTRALLLAAWMQTVGAVRAVFSAKE